MGNPWEMGLIGKALGQGWVRPKFRRQTPPFPNQKPFRLSFVWVSHRHLMYIHIHFDWFTWLFMGKIVSILRNYKECVIKLRYEWVKLQVVSLIWSKRQHNFAKCAICSNTFSNGDTVYIKNYGVGINIPLCKECAAARGITSQVKVPIPVA